MDKLILICSFFITVVCIVRCCLTSKKNLSDIFLNISLLFLLLITIVYYLGVSSSITDFPHFYRIGTISTFIYMPASYLFIKYTLQKSKFKFADLIVFIPAALFLLDYLPFFLQNADYKLKALLLDINNESVHLHLQSQWMPAGTYYILQNSLGVVLGVMQLRLIAKLLMLGGKAYYKDNANIIQWFAVWSFLLIASCLPDVLNGTIGYAINIKDYIYVTPCLLLYFLYPLSILINPRLLYGSRGFWISKNSPAKITQLINALTISRQKVQIDNHINDILGHSLQLLQESNHQSSVVNLPNFSADKKYFDESQAAHLKKTLDTIITVNKIYLVKQLDIKDLASAMSVHHNYLQAFISQYIGLSFSDFIDSYRIKAFIDHYTSSELKSIHESAIASGFDNENNMMEAFKKITGTNPDLYFTK